jgi:hypothetical protein
MSDEDDETTADENACPFCGCPYGDCEHVLLLVDITFSTANGGELLDAFDDRLRTIADQENDDFNERRTVNQLLEEVDSLSDASLGYTIEGGPGNTSSCIDYFCSSKERVQEAVARFEAGTLEIDTRRLNT